MNGRQWAMLLHFSLLAGIIPGLGHLVAIILPIIVWQLKKTDFPEIDPHGKVVVNWIISAVIYAFICGGLVFVFVGIPLLIILGALWIIFPIIGGIKASSGVVWRYPLSIPFFN
jgi:uncharacterized protein